MVEFVPFVFLVPEIKVVRYPAVLVKMHVEVRTASRSESCFDSLSMENHHVRQNLCIAPGVREKSGFSGKSHPPRSLAKTCFAVAASPSQAHLQPLNFYDCARHLP